MSVPIEFSEESHGPEEVRFIAQQTRGFHDHFLRSKQRETIAAQGSALEDNTRARGISTL